FVTHTVSALQFMLEDYHLSISFMRGAEMKGHIPLERSARFYWVVPLGRPCFELCRRSSLPCVMLPVLIDCLAPTTREVRSTNSSECSRPLPHHSIRMLIIGYVWQRRLNQ